MKNLIIHFIFTFLILTSTLAIPQSSSPENKKMEIALDNCVVALNSGVNGMVESTLFMIMVCKEKYPDLDYKKIIVELARLSVEGETPAIRQKAFICKTYLENLDWFENIHFQKAENQDEHIYFEDEYFRKINERIQNKIFALN